MNKRTPSYFTGDFEDENAKQVGWYSSTYNKPFFTGEMGWYDSIAYLKNDHPTAYEYHCVMRSNMFNGSVGALAYWIHQDLLFYGGNTL